MEILIVLLLFKWLLRVKKYERSTFVTCSILSASTLQPRIGFLDAQTYHDGASHASIHLWVTKCSEVCEEFAHTRCIHVPRIMHPWKEGAKVGRCCSPSLQFFDAQTSHDGASHASIHLWVTKCIKLCEEFAHTRCIHVPSPHRPSQTLRA